MKALWIRHAEASGQAADAPLSPLGMHQAEALGDVLLTLHAGPLYASPYARAIATLAPSYAGRTGQTITPLPGLRERSLSPVQLPDWQAHVARSFDDHFHAPEGGESFEDLSARAAPDLARVALLGGAMPCIVSHGNLTSALFHAADPSFGFEDWRAMRNPDLFEVALADGRITSFTRLVLKETT
jgi:2,3-bisphosphoglycerate-dependent phosphoglycerate mutase